MMRYEIQLEAEETSEKFKANLFAGNTELYYKLFEEKKDPLPGGSDDVQFPESVEEFKEMVASMQREGFTDHYDRAEALPPEEIS